MLTGRVLTCVRPSHKSATRVHEQDLSMLGLECRQKTLCQNIGSAEVSFVLTVQPVSIGGFKRVQPDSTSAVNQDMNRLSIAINICNDLPNIAIDLQVRLVTATSGCLAFGGVGNQLQGF